MKVVKETNEYTIVEKRNGRYGVRDANRKWVNGDEKVKILLAEKLIKAAPPKPKEEPAQEEASEEAAAEGEAEASQGD